MALGNLYSKKSKTILLFSYLLISVYSLLIINSNINNVENNIELTGTILDINIKKTYSSLTVQSKKNKYIVYTNNNNFILGQKVYIKGIKKNPDKNRNFHLFNYQNYLKSKNIDYIILSKEIYIRNEKPNIVFRIKNLFLEYTKRLKNEKYYLLFIYGKNELEENIYENYKSIGIIHLFAISGMHVNLIILILNKIFNKNKNIIVLFLIFYLLFVNPSPSIYRASLTEILYIILKKKVNKTNILVFLFFSNLLFNPYIIYHLGFQLSYLISITLNIFKVKDNNYIKNMFKTTYKSFLVSMPIIINQTFSLNFLTILYNLFFIPFVSYIFFPSILICFFIPKLEFILTYQITFIEKFSSTIANINYLTFNFSHLNVLKLIILYLFIFITLYNKKYIITLILFLFFHSCSHYLLKNNIITFLDVEQGDSTLIEIKENAGAILIDTGGNQNKELSKNIIIPILKSKGIKYLNLLILTHGDYDHMGEAINLVNNFKVEKVVFNCGKFNELEQDLIKVLDKKKIPYYSCIKELNFDDNKLYFLNSGDYGNENDNSNVIYTELNNHKFLFMGDAGVEVEEDLIKKYNLQDIDVLKVGHHGSKTSSSKNFIDKIEPKYSIISVGKNNRYGHPNDIVLDNLADSKIYRTDQDGSIMFKIKNNKLKIETCAP